MMNMPTASGRRSWRVSAAVFALLGAVFAPAVFQAEARGQQVAPRASVLDPNLPFYRPIERLEGKLAMGGSNTLSHVASVWADGFRKFYPDVEIAIQINGSRSAVENVKAGKASFGLLSRTILREEVEGFIEAFGYAPLVVTPCLERTGIFVHDDNPIQGLTISQLDAIYSATCKRVKATHDSGAPCRTWAQVGLTGEWANRPIIAHGRSKDTGSQMFLQQAVMLGGELRDDLVRHKSNVDMLEAVAQDPRAIGFSGLSYATKGVRPVPLAFSEREGFVAIDSPEADQGQYPLVRRLQFVVNHKPQAELRAVEREFLKYVFSRLGQEDVVRAGFQPIRAQGARVALDQVGLAVAR